MLSQPGKPVQTATTVSDSEARFCVQVFASERGAFAVIVLTVNVVPQRENDPWFRESSRLQGFEISQNPGLIPEHRQNVEAVPANGSVLAHHHHARFTVKE